MKKIFSAIYSVDLCHFTLPSFFVVFILCTSLHVVGCPSREVDCADDRVRAKGGKQE